jgi:hypothetical protein
MLYGMNNLPSHLDAVYEFIYEYIWQKGYAPSLLEIADALSLAIVTVDGYLDELEALEKIKQVPHKPRSIRIL